MYFLFRIQINTLKLMKLTQLNEYNYYDQNYALILVRYQIELTRIMYFELVRFSFEQT